MKPKADEIYIKKLELQVQELGGVLNYLLAFYLREPMRWYDHIQVIRSVLPSTKER